MSVTLEFIMPFQIHNFILIHATIAQMRKLESQMLTDFGPFHKVGTW